MPINNDPEIQQLVYEIIQLLDDKTRYEFNFDLDFLKDKYKQALSDPDVNLLTVDELYLDCNKEYLNNPINDKITELDKVIHKKLKN